MILLNPGPTNTRAATKRSQTNNTDICHRTPDFLASYNLLKKELIRVYNPIDPDKWLATILGGSGTAALESMILSLVPDNCLVIDAGNYGARAITIMKRNGIQHTVIKVNNVAELKQNKEIKNVYFVENETTTGEKFSLEKMVKIYPNAMFYIDATSAFGASDYSLFTSQISAISFCSNKCLQAPAGLGIVLHNKSAKFYSRASYYLDLKVYQEGLPFTIPPQLIESLRTSLEIREETEEIFNSRKDLLIKDLQKMGIVCVNKFPSNSVIGFQHPSLSYEELETLLARKNIVIYSGIPGIVNSFRVSTMSSIFEDKYSYILEAFNDSCIC